MIIYNITININYPAEKDWLRFMKQEQQPGMLATGIPTDVKIFRLLTEIENEGSTYTTQLTFRTMEDFLAYQTDFQDEFVERHHSLFNGHYVSFRTLLEEV